MYITLQKQSVRLISRWRIYKVKHFAARNPKENLEHDRGLIRLQSFISSNNSQSMLHTDIDSSSQGGIMQFLVACVCFT